MPLLVLAAQEPEAPLRRVAASALADVAKHSPELAQAVVDAGAAPTLFLAPPGIQRGAAATEHCSACSMGRMSCPWRASLCSSHHARWQIPVP